MPHIPWVLKVLLNDWECPTRLHFFGRGGSKLQKKDDMTTACAGADALLSGSLDKAVEAGSAERSMAMDGLRRRGIRCVRRGPV